MSQARSHTARSERAIARRQGKLSVISLFSGALGLDLGLEATGFTTRVTVETNPAAVETIRKNRPAIPVIDRDICTVTTAEILKRAGLRKGEATVVAGGPCCQPFSTAGRRGSVGDESGRGTLFKEFCRVVNEARPRFFVMENVTGVLSAAVTHRPLAERGAGHPLLTQNERLGSALLVVLKELKSLGYHVTFNVLNAADYGAPQARSRVIFIGSRDNEPVTFTPPTHSKDGAGGLPAWRTLGDAIAGLVDPSPECVRFSEAKAAVMRLVPEGGNWKDLPVDVQQRVMGKAYTSWGGRVGFWRRLAFNRVAPSLTTRPTGRATMFGHPTELRPLSVREYARIQQFPDDWVFCGTLEQRYTQVGNAVPVGLAEVIGRTLRQTMRRRHRVVGRNVVSCPRALLQKLSKLTPTRLDPPRMRKVKGIKENASWVAEIAGAVGHRRREELLELVTPSEEIRRRPKPQIGTRMPGVLPHPRHTRKGQRSQGVRNGHIGVIALPAKGTRRCRSVPKRPGSPSLVPTRRRVA